MNERLTHLTHGIERRSPGDIDALTSAAAARGVDLPSDYLDFMRYSDGGWGDVGPNWIEFWSVEEILDMAMGEQRYPGVLLFAGGGANTIYGFDATADGEIVEGDWIGLNYDEVIRYGKGFTDFLDALESEEE